MNKMIKKTITILLFIAFVCTFFACGQNGSDDSASDNSEALQESSSTENEEKLGVGKLIVNGEEIANENIDIHESYAKVPLTPVLNALGYEITWGTGGVALLKYNEKTYILNTSAKTLKEEGSSENLLLQNEQSGSVCEVSGKELVIDEVLLYTLLERMGTPVRVSLDYENLTVSINKK